MPDSEAKTLLRLRGSVQSYDWGRRGSDSTVARLFAHNSGAEIAPDRPYAELWMGTHESGPSFVVDDGGMTLKDWIEKNPGIALGRGIADKWGSHLPFLFKVLSVAKALSIQAHPDKKLARTLHELQPNNYKDDNHKPEMALAITEFEALCGFISIEELKDVLKQVPEIVDLIDRVEAENFLNINQHDGTGEENIKSALRLVFTRLMSSSKDMTVRAITNLKSRLQKESQVRHLTDKEQLVLQLEKQYPADIGVISAFFLNYVKLKPGEALYLGANELHAYLSGECVECMATSDNVVRAGLTPKHRDVQTLCSMLTYKQGRPEILRGFPLSPYTTRYLPPFDEFELDCCSLPRGASTVFPAIAGPSIFVILSGEGILQTGSSKDVNVAEGDMFFAAAETEISISTSTELKLYRAGVNSRILQSVNWS